MTTRERERERERASMIKNNRTPFYLVIHVYQAGRRTEVEGR